MSGFEHYSAELADVDREIQHYAVVCGVDPGDQLALQALLAGHARQHDSDRTRETLRGLLQLRIRIETEMLELGIRPPERRTNREPTR